MKTVPDLEGTYTLTRMHGCFLDLHSEGASSEGIVFKVRLDSKGSFRVVYCHACIVVILINHNQCVSKHSFGQTGSLR